MKFRKPIIFIATIVLALIGALIGYRAISGNEKQTDKTEIEKTREEAKREAADLEEKVRETKEAAENAKKEAEELERARQKARDRELGDFPTGKWPLKIDRNPTK